MRKKTLAMLLILALVISIVPMAAMAAETDECTHPATSCYYTATSISGTGSHDYVCGDCGAVLGVYGHTWKDGKCEVCGAPDPDYKPECDHMGNHWSYNPNGNGTHDLVCQDCGTVVTKAVPCYYEDGVCTACKAKEPVVPCEKHKFDTNGKCTVCGYVCDHVTGPQKLTDSGDGKNHYAFCSACNALCDTTPHIYENGVCACGAKEPACDHTGNNWKYTDNGDGTHKVICKDCGITVTKAAKCVWENGKACVCGSKEPVCDHMGNNWKYADNGDGTHKVICKDCGIVVTKAAKCVWENGKACVCGSTKPEETKPQETKPEETKPQEPKPQEPKPDGLDNVPKTGDSGTVILVSTAVLVMCLGTAVCLVTLKKRA